METHHLLPNNHFGARKGRSTTQALSALQERTWDAWRERKVLSLVSFDVKGAFNGVNREVLLRRLRERRVPETLVRWVGDFCQKRKATVMLNGHNTPIVELEAAGIPQGSPLSPILFLFFNANLVQNVINKHQGAIAFVDDYTAWVTGPTAAENTRKLHERFVPRAEAWEESRGATFQPEKTAFIHFTRNKKRLDETPVPLIVRDCPVRPSDSVKVLGVILDQELRYKHHMARVAKRGTRAVMALKRLKALRPSTARQLFATTVVPTVDYASFIWSSHQTSSMIRILQPIQRMAAQAIVGTFRTVALPIAEAEAAIEPLQTRWRRQSLRAWVDLHTLPAKHPFWKSKRRVDVTNKRFVSPLQKQAQQWRDVELTHVETITPYCVPPWYGQAEIEIHEHDRAMEIVQDLTGDVEFYTDGSVRNELVGVAVWCKVGGRNECIGKSQDFNVYFAELFAIWRVVQSIETNTVTHPNDRPRRFIIRTDSQAALKSLARPRRQSGQHIIASILESVHRLKAQQIRITFTWVPAHTGIEGNEAAHSLAQVATSTDRLPPLIRMPRLKSAALRCAGHEIPPPAKSSSDLQHYARQVDLALPGDHTRLLYDPLTKSEAGFLAQLRTGKCRLNGYLARIKAVESDQCSCGRGPETVKHFLFQWPQWYTMRDQMRQAFPHRFGGLAFWMGGWSSHQHFNGRYVDGKDLSGNLTRQQLNKHWHL